MLVTVVLIELLSQQKNQAKGNSLYPADHAVRYLKRIPLKEQGNDQIDGREYT